MAATLRTLGECRRLGVHGFTSPLLKNIGILFLDMVRHQSSQNIRFPPCYVPESSLCRPPWQEFPVIDPTEEAKQHQGVILKVNNILAAGKYGRLFAVVHFASRQWKVTNEDMILTESHIDAECGDQIRLEKSRFGKSGGYSRRENTILAQSSHAFLETAQIPKEKNYSSTSNSATDQHN